jgi:hypothetical protein
MPFSSYCNGAIPDEEGLEFASLEAAEHEAACTAAEIGRDRLPTGDAREITVEVRNGHRQRAVTIRVAMSLRPSPSAGETIVRECPIVPFMELCLARGT